MSTYLDQILLAHRLEAREDGRSTGELVKKALQLPPARGFRAALARVDGLGVIAEIKRRSPSRGDLNLGLNPAEWAAAYADGGATCLSVLTDGAHFGGSPHDLRAARRAVAIPVLRKDFTVSANDVLDARIMGADCVLLIVSALSVEELGEYIGLADSVGLDVLVEAHSQVEVEAALACDADLIGVNQRDLVTFEVDTDLAVRLANFLPPGVVGVAESGVQGPEDAGILHRAGYGAVLVGESLVSSSDPAASVAMLRGLRTNDRAIRRI